MKQNKTAFKYRIPVIISVIVLALLAVYLLVSTIFFEKFYMYRKQNMLEKSFYEVRSIIENGNTADVLSEFEKLVNNSGISVILLDSSGEVIASGTTNVRPLRDQFFEAIFASRNDDNMIVRHRDYFIQRLSDADTGIDYMVLCGNTDDNRFIMLRVTIENIRENVGLANTFQTYIIVILSVLCIIIVFIVSKLKIANRKLEEDIKERKEIDDMRKEFIANVSHELKTPIALIQGYAEGLKEGVASDEESRNEYCDVIIDESVRMNKMVRQLLNLTRIESGTDTVSLENFDIAEMIRSKMAAFDIKAKQDGITFVFDINEPWIVRSDPGKIEEVIDNFYGNAIDHVSGEKRIITDIADTGDKIRISVYNTGEHIPEEDMEKIWVKMYKVDKARTRQFGGAGLGLSIVKAIMDELECGYGAENTDGGVRFWFETDKVS